MYFLSTNDDELKTFFKTCLCFRTSDTLAIRFDAQFLNQSIVDVHASSLAPQSAELLLLVQYEPSRFAEFPLVIGYETEWFVFDAELVGPRLHHVRIVARDHYDFVDAFFFEFLVVVDVALQVVLTKNPHSSSTLVVK